MRRGTPIATWCDRLGVERITARARKLDRMAAKKSRETCRHSLRILHLQQVRRLGQDEGLDIGQPREQQFLPLAPNITQLQTPGPDHREGRLDDATRVLLGER